MALTEADWAAANRANAARPTPRPVNETLLRQAVVDSGLLTNHVGWDKYLSRLQVLLEEAQANLTHWRDKIAGAYSDADLRTVQMQVNVYQERVHVLTQCMSLPKEIVAHAADSLDKS